MFADVTSANVVGYSTRALPPSGEFDTVAAMFFNPGQAVSESSITLGDIVLKNVTDSTVLQLIHRTNGATRDFTFAELQAVNPAWDEGFYNQYLSMYGIDAMPATFVYKTAENTQSGEDGWYCQFDSFAFFKMDAFVLDFGDGLIVCSGDNSAGFQFSGQVLDKNYSYPLPSSGQFGMIANPCPTAKMLADFVPDGATESTVLQLIHRTNGATRDFTFAELQAVNPAWDETFYNQYLSMYGIDAMPATFVYKTAENTQSGEDGWYCQFDSFGFFKMNAMSVPAGMAFILCSGDNNAGIVLPKENL